MPDGDSTTEVLARRPRRADAKRNYDKLVAAAREAFAESGVSASLEDIARRAGVGIGTLYRHFPTRRELLESVYVEEVEAVCRSADELAPREPWDALVAWLDRFVAYTATKRAVAEGLSSDSDLLTTCRDAIFAAGRPLLERAQQAGVARRDVDFDDMMRLVFGIAMTQFDSPDQLARVLRVAIDGLRPPRS